MADHSVSLARAPNSWSIRVGRAAERRPANSAQKPSCWPPAPTARPGILLRSGVGAERELPVGEGLIDHVGVGFGFEGTQRLQREVAAFERSHPLFMAQVTVAISSSACARGLSDLFFFPGIDPRGAQAYEVSVAVFAMKPASRGSVRLHSSDPRVPLSIDHGFLSDPDDSTVLTEGVESLRAVSSTRLRRARSAGSSTAAAVSTGSTGS